MKIHPSITTTRTTEAVERSQDLHCLDCSGFCVSCGIEVAHVEPDAGGCVCPRCGKLAAYAAVDLLTMLTPSPKGVLQFFDRGGRS